MADCFYGDNDELEAILGERKIPYVLAHRGGVSRGWARAEEAHSFEEALQRVPLKAWKKIHRRFSDGHRKTWWAVELQFMYFGPYKARRAICATTDRRKRPDQTTWYLSTNIKRASLEEITDIYAKRNWVEDSYNGSKVSSAGPTFRCVLKRPSAAIGRSCVPPSAFAGGKRHAKRPCPRPPPKANLSNKGLARRRARKKIRHRLDTRGRARYARCALGSPRIDGSRIIGAPSARRPPPRALEEFVFALRSGERINLYLLL